MGPELAELVKQQRDVMLLQEVCTSEQLKHTLEDYSYLYTKKLWVEYQLLSFPHRKSKEMPVTSEQQAVSLALFTFSQPIIRVTRATAAFPKAMALQLIRAIEKSDLSKNWDPCSELLLWVLFIAALLSQGEVKWSWIVARIADTTRHLQIDTAEQLRELLDGFYYFPEYFETVLQDVWSEVQVANNQNLLRDGPFQSFAALPHR